MAAEENKALFLRYFAEGANQGNLNVIEDIFSADYLHHDPANIDSIGGVEDVKRHIIMLRHAFPDLEFHIHDMVADQDNVVVRWTVTGTHNGDYFGIPATGKTLSITGMNHWRVANGRAVEGWVSRDDLGLMRQLGLIPG